MMSSPADQYCGIIFSRHADQYCGFILSRPADQYCGFMMSRHAVYIELAHWPLLFVYAE